MSDRGAGQGVRPPPSVEVIRDSTSNLERRCLLITAAFPPSSVVGALRWEKFCRYFHDAGLGVDVVTMHPDEAELPDMSRLAGLPPSVRVLGARATTPWTLRAAGLLHGAKARLVADRRTTVAASREAPSYGASPAGVHDSGLMRTADIRSLPRSRSEWARVYRGWLARQQEFAWSDAARIAAMRLVHDRAYDAVLSSGPPNSAHIVARRVAQSINRPFMMDMRDPWGTAVAVTAGTASALEMAVARRRELECVQLASLVVVNTPVARDLLVARYPAADSRCLVVMNGTDDDAELSALPRTRFTIVFAGSIYFDRNPRLVFRAAARVIASLDLDPDDFGFEFIGGAESYGGTSTTAIASQEGIGPYVRTERFMPRAQLLERLRQASVLLSLPQDVETSVPAKIFEYMSLPSSLLILAARGSATERLLEGTDADVVNPQDVEGMVDRITHRYQEFRRGVVPEPIGRGGRFSRARQARLLTDRLTTVIKDHRNTQ